MTMLKAGKTGLSKINVEMLVIVIMYPPITPPKEREKEPIELKRPNATLLSVFGITSVM